MTEKNNPHHFPGANNRASRSQHNLLIEVKDLRTRFHIAEGTVHAVNGISFKLHECETLAIVGESGCGKSVSMMSVMGLIPIPPGEIASGEVYYHGRDLLKLSEKEMESLRGREIAMVFQDPMTALNPVLTIERQLSEPLRTHLGMDEQMARQRSVELLEQVGIPDAARRVRSYPHEFSGGMRQRAMIAMALSCEPQLLIADEPTTALDVTIQAQIVDLVIRLQQELGMAVMWITHDLGVVAEMAYKINVMYAGYIIERGHVRDIYKKTRHPYTIGLLGSLPRIDEPPGTKLMSIPGLPPDLLALPPGCPFAARCLYRVERCLQEMPPLEETDGVEHTVACWRWEYIAGRGS